jgi:hypothetical protein
MKLCGMKNAKGDECVLEHGHTHGGLDWKYRIHKTSKGDTFTYAQERGKAYRQFGSGAQNLVATNW